MMIVLDFETYYDSKIGYSLRDMTTEEYVLDKRFHILGCAVKIGKAPAKWMEPAQFQEWVREVDWDKVYLVGHNLKFDGFILQWRYGKSPKLFCDTLAISNIYIKPYTHRASLAASAKFLGLAEKGTTLLRLDGVTYSMLRQNPTLHRECMAYGCHDAELSSDIWTWGWYRIKKHPTELLLIDWSVRAFTRPKLQLNLDLVADVLEKATKDQAESRAAAGITDASILRSPAKFAKLLEEKGIQVDLKEGAGGRMIPAVAKKDPFMQKLLTHPDLQVRQVAHCRLLAASTLEITRSAKLLSAGRIAQRRLCVGLNYYSAHTGRFGGDGGRNLQNLPRASRLREAIEAGDGYVLVSADASQVEARTVAWMAGCRMLVDAFEAKRDVYCEFGSSLYGRTITKEDKAERQIAKAAVLGAGYGMSGAKFQLYLQASGIEVSEAEAKEIIDTYRKEYWQIPQFWRRCEALLMSAVRNDQEKTFVLPSGAELKFTPYGIVRPTGLMIQYPELRIDKNKDQLTYKRGPLWGGKIVENIVQSFCRDLIVLVHVKHRKVIVLQVHDELVGKVPEVQGIFFLHELILDMSTPPTWAATLPLAAEGRIGKTYAK